jgi:4-hydroxybenzoate polyprenyltransferase
LSMGRHVRVGVSLCYLLALGLWATAIWQVRPDGLALVALLPMAGHLLWQVATLREDGVDPLTKFRANRFAGLLMFLACLVVGSA